jgi:PTS system mannose-specific IIB component/fructoselysine and glucoselysine-specific PTS system IIB component
MSVALFRVDERLIHGQVVVGWGSQLHPQLIVVVDDELAESDWEQELYCLGLPPEVATHFLTVEQARDAVPGWLKDATRMIVLTRDVSTMSRLARGGLLRGVEVNIGGLHHAPGRREVLPYVFLSAAETESLRELASEGAQVSARDLPGSRRVDLGHLLRTGSAR